MTAIAIFGISGRTGQALTSDGRARGWTVRGFGRISSVAPVGASMISGGFSETERLREVVRGADAVYCVFGPRPPYRDVFCGAATRAVIDAMQATECRRLLCLTGAMIGSLSSRSAPMSWMAAVFARRHPAMAADRVDQEAAILASDLEWTIVKPPRLTDAGPRGAVMAGPALRVGLLSSISRTDLARYLLDVAADPSAVRQRVVVKNRR